MHIHTHTKIEKTGGKDTQKRVCIPQRSAGLPLVFALVRHSAATALLMLSLPSVLLAAALTAVTAAVVADGAVTAVVYVIDVLDVQSGGVRSVAVTAVGGGMWTPPVLLQCGDNPAMDTVSEESGTHRPLLHGIPMWSVTACVSLRSLSRRRDSGDPFCHRRCCCRC